ncbi:MAG: 50S ribosomal protein L11 methyltransferase [Bacteroidales bacterium]|nr:50S ribosomal protein L11 methyltransferase [Bacteroidales bacterium]
MYAFRFNLPQNENQLKELLIAELDLMEFEGIEEYDNYIIGYLPDSLFSSSIISKIKNAYFNFKSLDISYAVVENKNWNEEWEKNFEPVVIDGLCLIRAPFHQIAEKYPFEIIIEPKMSFGTGHHETTELMVRGILETEMQNKKVLDMGCGTGVLAILASKQGAGNIMAIDIDEWAYTNTLENIERNRVKNIKVIQGDAGKIEDHKFDIILANINRNILLNDIKTYGKSLYTGGHLMVSGILEADSKTIIDTATVNYLEYIGTKTKGNWIMIRFLKK